MMQNRLLGHSPLAVTPICLGTMTFGEQVPTALAHAILDRSLERGVNFIDTAEMYSVPARADTYGATETILGSWFASRPGVRQQVVVATKVAGPSRAMPWIRGDGSGLSRAEIMAACDGSLRRLQTDVIDLYQIHWPARNVPIFGGMYFDPSHNKACATIHEQLETLSELVRAGKVRAIGLSNESPYGVHEFVRLAEQHGLPRVATVQNPYCLINRSLENGLDETLHHLGVSLLAYSPLGFGSLTGKYDGVDLHAPTDPVAAAGAPTAVGRLALYDTMKQQRWARHDALHAANLYNTLARDYGLTPTQMALAFCYTKWQVTSTIIGVTSVPQLDECLDAWGTTLSTDVLEAIDTFRWTHRDPAV